MTVLVKYCGGCNSRYDRTAFVENLKKEFPSARFVYAGDGITEADVALVVCGCPAVCASHDALRARYAKLVISSQDEYDAARETMAQYIPEHRP